MNRANLVTLNVACEVLGCSTTNIINTPKYQEFYHPVKGRRELRVFDLEGYNKKEDLRFEFIEKTKLFIEWLIHEKGILPTHIAKRSRVSKPQVYEHSLSVVSAYKIVKTYRYYLNEFDRFYGWPTKRKETK